VRTDFGADCDFGGTCFTAPDVTLGQFNSGRGWILTTRIAIYCILTGRTQQHREWMMRSYPFAAVFIVARAVSAIPAIDRMGLEGLENTVWCSVALAGTLPSYVIALRALATSKRAVKPRITAAGRLSFVVRATCQSKVPRTKLAEQSGR
jgi:hypothetical protein